MSGALSIGVVGGGTAGPAAALFLRRAGHRVTLFERVPDPSTVGAGIMLQPTGQAVLDQLGLLEEVLTRGERIDRLNVICGQRVDERAGESRQLLDLRYRDVLPNAFGVGLHRGVLFSSLFRAVQKADIALRLGEEAVGASMVGARVSLHLATGERTEPFDLVVVADGARSRLRDQLAIVRRADGYPWGALWFMADDPSHAFREELFQVCCGTRELLGLLPTGLGPEVDSKVPQVSLFWSVRADDVNRTKSAFGAWKERVIQLAPRAEPLVAQIKSADDLLYSAYYDVVMSPWHVGPIVFLGDAAHAMSPQLGQGANLALYDALTLAESVRDERDAIVAVSTYSRRRSAHLAYYQLVTRWLTPFFQSDYDLLGVLRDLSMPIMNRMGVFNRAMVLGMCGIADGHPWRRIPLDVGPRLVERAQVADPEAPPTEES